MSSRLNPYLNFNGNAREAMKFYEGVFGGKLTASTFKEFGMSSDPQDENKIMHAQLDAGGTIFLMAADTPKHMEYRPAAGFGISLSGENEKELRGYWDKLARGATITQPLEKAPWGDTFGMLTDKFGIDWMVNVTTPKA